MRVGLAGLRLAPRDFWAMTPRELAAAVGSFSTRQAMPTRQWLGALERQLLANGETENG